MRSGYPCGYPCVVWFYTYCQLQVESLCGSPALYSAARNRNQRLARCVNLFAYSCLLRPHCKRGTEATLPKTGAFSATPGLSAWSAERKNLRGKQKSQDSRSRKSNPSEETSPSSALQSLWGSAALTARPCSSRWSSRRKDGPSSGPSKLLSIWNRFFFSVSGKGQWGSFVGLAQRRSYHWLCENVAMHNSFNGKAGHDIMASGP